MLARRGGTGLQRVVQISARAAFAVVVMAIGGFASAQDASVLGQPVSALFFGQFDYRERESQSDDGFAIGQGIAQFNVQLDSRLSVFTELSATARKGQDFEFEVERLFVRYDFSDQYKLSAGRYHTPLGYWNSSFHHGSWLQTTVSRPETAKFGSNVIPIHFVGALLEGSVADSNFGYKIGFGNGRSDEINDPGDFGDSNGDRAWLLAGNYRPPGRYRLNTGVSLYIDKVSPDLAPDIDEQLFNAYVALEGESPEVLVEYTYSNHDSSLSKGSVNSIYGQLAYRLSGSAHPFKPYVRVERLDVDNDDPLLGTLGLDYKGIVAGTRWDFSSNAVLRAEVRREEFDNASSRNGVWLQLAFVFDATSHRNSHFPRTQPIGNAR